MKPVMSLMALSLMLGCAAEQHPAPPVQSANAAAGVKEPAAKADEPAAAPGASAAPTQSMKGFNLYSWLDDPSGKYYYALVPATNAEPDLSRVKAQGSTDLDALIKQLNALEAGAYVFWNPRVSIISSIHFMLPPQPARDRITGSAARLKLEIDPHYASDAR